ncbi:hypothetical protein GQ457_16G009380 [Hibiscus cannabinus]
MAAIVFVDRYLNPGLLINPLMSHSDLHVAVGTTLKFNSRNYAFWLQSFHTFLGSQGCDHHLVQTMADTKDSKYVAWGQYDCAMKTWLLNSLEPEIAASVGLISTANEMWDSIEEMFPNDVRGISSNKNNVRILVAVSQPAQNDDPAGVLSRGYRFEENAVSVITSIEVVAATSQTVSHDNQ